MKIPGLKKTRHWIRWLTSRLTGGALILGYHRIASEKHDYHSICVSPEHFEQQLQYLKQHACVISLDDLLEALRNSNVPARSVVITFDDGYADNLYQAWPILEQYGMPATIFVATGYLGRRFWWDELAQMIMEDDLLGDEISVKVTGKQFRWAAGEVDDSNAIDRERRYALLQKLYRFCLELPHGDRESAIAQLRKQRVGDIKTGSGSTRALTSEELSSLAASPLMTIGAHTISHPLLTKLPAEKQKEEIVRSKDELESVLGQPITTFSYPNGAVDQAVRDLVDQSGFDGACASLTNVVRPGSDPLRLPRFWIPDWDGKTFSRLLNRWL